MKRLELERTEHRQRGAESGTRQVPNRVREHGEGRSGLALVDVIGIRAQQVEVMDPSRIYCIQPTPSDPTTVSWLCCINGTYYSTRISLTGDSEKMSAEHECTPSQSIAPENSIRPATAAQPYNDLSINDGA